MLPERRFRALGSDVHLICSEEVALDEAQLFLEHFEATLSRFRPDSELVALNNSSQQLFPASPLLRRAVEAALAVAEQSAGLIDPTVLPALQKSGYKDSWRQSRQLSYENLLRLDLRTGPAASNPKSTWKEVRVLPTGKIEKPAGTKLDLGGTGKGLAVDMIAEMWQEYGTWAISIGGDLRLGGIHGREVIIDSPLEKRSFLASEGAVATSGTHRRAWLEQGIPQNHLRDPLTGNAVWGPYIQVTALAQTTQEAEFLAKMTLLRGDSSYLQKGMLLDWQGGWTDIG